MPDWTDGYVSDIAYTGGYYREQTPAHLDAACLANGVEPAVPAGAPFAYCELGCGLGDTAMTIAASCPHAEVYGFDFNPAHIARARDVAARTGLGNVRFAERSFEDLAAAAPSDLPEFDYITLHGVWSWVSPASQAHIVTFLNRRLRPGGVACISYNAMPGWSDNVGLQRLLLETSRGLVGSSDRRLSEAVALARRVADASPSAIAPARVEHIEKIIAEGQVVYASHEYLNEHWRPVFFAEVAAAMSAAKLSFVCSASLLENYPHLCMTAEQCALVESLPAGQRQTVQDFFYRRHFRYDLFIRGPRPIPPLTKRGRIGAQRIALTVPGRLASVEIKVPLGEATLNKAFYGPALARLDQGPAMIGELLAEASPGTAPVPAEVLGLLVGGRQVMAAGEDADAQAVAQVRRFNRTRLAIAAEESRTSWVIAAATLGAGIGVGLAEMLVFDVVAGAYEAGVEPTLEEVRAGVFALLETRHMNLKADTPDAAVGLADEIRTILTEWVPIWRGLGAL